MPIQNGSYTPLTFDNALKAIFAEAPASIVFSPGNPPELVLANMFAQADVVLDENNGQTLAALMSPVGSMIDLLNPNNPRRAASAASGYVYVTNSSGSPVSIAVDTLVTASSGQQYSVGLTSFVIPGSGSAYIFVTCTETGVGGNIPSGLAFSITGYPTLSGVNLLPFLNGAPEESDALYLNRVTSERTEYGSQNGSVAVENEIKRYYADARMYVNNVATALTDPVPVPGNGYNLVVLTSNGVLSAPEDIKQIFTILAERLEFINAQSVSSATHTVLAGVIYTSEIPQTYFFTVAQPVTTTFNATIDVRASSKADRSEIIAQVNKFATSFANRLVAYLSGVPGTMSVTYHDDTGDVVTDIDIAGSPSFSKSLAPAFGISAVSAFVYDYASVDETPQIVFDSVNAMTMIIDPEVVGESPVTLTLGGPVTFVNFKTDPLFTDSTSWFDRYLYIDPSNITLTIRVIEWI